VAQARLAIDRLLVGDHHVDYAMLQRLERPIGTPNCLRILDIPALHRLRMIRPPPAQTSAIDDFLVSARPSCSAPIAHAELHGLNKMSAAGLVDRA
jgi:hypothetical protein